MVGRSPAPVPETRGARGQRRFEAARAASIATLQSAGGEAFLELSELLLLQSRAGTRSTSNTPAEPAAILRAGPSQAHFSRENLAAAFLSRSGAAAPDRDARGSTPALREPALEP